MNRRLLYGALAGTLALAGGLALQPEPDVVPPPQAREPQPPATGTVAAWPGPAPVALRAWAGTPAPAAAEPAPAAEASPSAEAPPAAPTAAEAPPPPGRWVGRLDDTSGRAVLIEGPASARLVREQEVLDGQWRLERIGDDRLQWRWLPGGLLREQPRT